MLTAKSAPRTPNSPSDTSDYVAGIDGLRALAVISVLLFHLGFKRFSGGFVGVDVFFVISGYLITKNIIMDNERQRFSYLSFMSRRIVRLYPALIATLIICMTLGFLLLAPQHYKTLARSTISAFLSLSNFEFWKGSGYFDSSSEINPLLHTWSLGLEQQFYLVWPLLILAISKIHRAASLVYVLLGVCLASLVLSQLFITVEPIANYFLMPFRVFEFAIGGLSIWVEKYRPTRNLQLEGLFLIGFCLLLYSVLNFSAVTLFPGINALIPTIGASLCIVACDARYSGAILRNRPTIFIGTISYSLYLVHWPLIVFYKYYIYRQLLTIDKWALFFASVVFAYPLYQFVESKYRRVNIFNIRRRGIVKVAFAVCFIMTTALIVYQQNGKAFRKFSERVMPPEQFHQEQYGGKNYAQDSYDLGSTSAKKASALILGDSYARAHAASLDDLFKGLNKKIHPSFADACFFSEKYTSLLSGKPRTDCTDRLNYALTYLDNNPGLPLIYAISWGGYEEKISTLQGERVTFKNREYVDFILGNITEISNSIGDHKLIIIGSPPGIQSSTGLAACVERPRYLGNLCESRLTTDQSSGNAYSLNEEIRTLVRNKRNIIFLTPGDAFCTDGKCASLKDGKFIYSDARHLSKYGSMLFVSYFKSVFEGL